MFSLDGCKSANLDTPVFGPVCAVGEGCDVFLVVGNGLTQHLMSPPLFAVTTAFEMNVTSVRSSASNGLTRTGWTTATSFRDGDGW